MKQRLGPDDHLFLIMERLMGASTTPQLIWRIPVDPDDPSAVDKGLGHVRRVADRLADGRMSRHVHRIPGPARDRWHFTPDVGLISITDREIPADSQSDWVDSRLREPLDSVKGPTWCLCAAPTSDAHLLVSLVWTHVISDGASAIRAIIEAVDEVNGVQPEEAPESMPDKVLDQVRDTFTLFVQSSLAVADLVHSTLKNRRRPKNTEHDVQPHRAEPAEQAATPEDTTADGTVTVPSVSVHLDAAAFAETARSAGGTPNSLFQAMTLGVLAASGRVADGDTVPVSVPISMRDTPELTGDLRANATTGATLPVTVSPEIHQDLSHLRIAAKDAYRAVTEQESSGPNHTVSLTELAQALPDSLVKRLASGATLPLCLASNLGDSGPSFSTLGFGTEPVGGRPVTVAPRMALQAGSRRQIIARRGGLSAWAMQFGPTLALSFTSLDPVHVDDEEHLHDLVSGELKRWGLQATTFL